MNEDNQKHVSCRVEGPCGNVEFGVTQLPDRKQPCLYRARGTMICPLAYFRSEEDAETFDRILNTVIDTLQELIRRVDISYRPIKNKKD